MKCPNCGTEVKDTYRFCIKCGSDMTGENARRPTEEPVPAYGSPDKAAEPNLVVPDAEPVPVPAPDPEQEAPLSAPAQAKPDGTGIKKASVIRVLACAAIACFLVSGFFAYKGYDKLTNYYNSDNYPRLNKNAYVGGDAYNYIINGNYATGYFVLSMGFLVSGVVFLCGSAAMNIAADTENRKLEILAEWKEEYPGRK